MRGNKLSKIGVFDSGLGGLIILKAIRKTLPQYDYVYFGDTKNLPYGDKTQREIFNLTVAGIEKLIKQGCSLIIIACNTASTKALRKIQQQWLPKHAPQTKVLGVVVPTIEALTKKDYPTLLIGTESTVKSSAYQKELNKLFPAEKLIGLPTPQLVPLLEKGQINEASRSLKQSLSLGPKFNTLILGCTHYSLMSKNIRKSYPRVKILDQAKIIPHALKTYLTKHPEIRKLLGTFKSVSISFSKNTTTNKQLAKLWFK